MVLVTLYKNDDYSDEWGSVELSERKFDTLTKFLEAVYQTLPPEKAIETSANEPMTKLIVSGIRSFRVVPEVEFNGENPTNGFPFGLTSSQLKRGQ